MTEIFSLVLYITLRAALYGIIAIVAVSWAVGMIVIYSPKKLAKRVKHG